MSKIQRSPEDTRCRICSRFIPHGTTVNLDKGKAACIAHPHGTTALDKGGYTPEDADEIITQRNLRDIKRRRREFAESLAPRPLSFELV